MRLCEGAAGVAHRLLVPAEPIEGFVPRPQQHLTPTRCCGLVLLLTDPLRSPTLAAPEAFLLRGDGGTHLSTPELEGALRDGEVRSRSFEVLLGSRELLSTAPDVRAAQLSERREGGARPGHGRNPNPGAQSCPKRRQHPDPTPDPRTAWLGTAPRGGPIARRSPERQHPTMYDEGVGEVAEPAALDEPAYIVLTAVHAFERLDLRVIAARADGWLSSSPTTVRLADGSYCVCMRYGVVVFVGSSDTAREDFLEFLGACGAERKSQPEVDELRLRVRPERVDRMVADTLEIQSTSLYRFQVIAEVLARSVVLSSYEAVLREAADLAEPLARDLAARGNSRHAARELLRSIGSVLHIRQQLVGRAEVTEKPDLLWDHPELERLFHLLNDELEIVERNLALGAKLDLITETARTALDLVQHRATLRVEWYIVALIVVEIVLSLVDRWF